MGLVLGIKKNKSVLAGSDIIIVTDIISKNIVIVDVNGLKKTIEYDKATKLPCGLELSLGISSQKDIARLRFEGDKSIRISRQQ